jgi:hypothetical protein
VDIRTETAHIDDVWELHRCWSIVAGRLQDAYRKLQVTNLCLLLAGSVAGAIAASGWLDTPAAKSVVVGSAVLLAAAAFMQSHLLVRANVQRRLVARAASETLKAAAYTYLARAAPFAGSDRDHVLYQRLAAVRDRTDDHIGLLAGVRDDGKPQPRMGSVADYVRLRAAGQRDWHESRAARHQVMARRWRWGQLAATGAAAVVAAVGGAMSGTDLSIWVSVLTTVAAALAAHVAGEQHDRIATSYVRTALRLRSLTRGFDPAVAGQPESDLFVERVEQVLAEQTDAWVELWHPSE